MDVSGKLHAPAALTPGWKNRRLCGPQSRSRRFWKREESLKPTGTRTPMYVLTIPTELSRVSKFYIYDSFNDPVSTCEQWRLIALRYETGNYFEGVRRQTIPVQTDCRAQNVPGS